MNKDDQIAEDRKKLFNQVPYNPLHVLHQLLPRQFTASQNYNIRPHDMTKKNY